MKNHIVYCVMSIRQQDKCKISKNDGTIVPILFLGTTVPFLLLNIPIKYNLLHSIDNEYNLEKARRDIYESENRESITFGPADAGRCTDADGGFKCWL